MLKYILLIQILLSGTILSQKVDSLIQVYPGIGDTLNFFNRTYIGLYPEVKNFNYAVFYIRDNDSLVTNIYSSTEDSTIELVRIQNKSSLDSISSIIYAIDFINKQLLLNTNDIYLLTKSGTWLEGQLEMFDSKYIYVFANNVTADHIGYMRYRIPVSEINQLTIEGTSNTLAGMCIGSAAGGVIGAITYAAIRKNDNSNSLKNCTSNFNNAAEASAACVGIALGGFLIGTLIGSSQSTDDRDIIFDTEMDVLKLSSYSYYVLDKEKLDETKYYDIY